MKAIVLTKEQNELKQKLAPFFFCVSFPFIYIPFIIGAAFYWLSEAFFSLHKKLDNGCDFLLEKTSQLKKGDKNEE